MWQRIRQFIAACCAAISSDDRQFVRTWLNEPEQNLFWQMNLPDQRHCLNVAYTARQLAKSGSAADLLVLTKSALLHDVGKVKGDVSTADKVITVLFHQIFGEKIKAWGRPGRGSRLVNLRHAFFVYFHHPARSAAKLRAIGTTETVIKIIEKHHEAPAENDPPELIILRAADDMN